ATPYAGAVAVREAFPRSSLVTLDAVVHAPLQAFANPCVDAAVAAHLLARSPRPAQEQCGMPSGAVATIGR
uniref:alpha/beta hydrolase n=1 Tax=Enterobacter hormaechei TaxID=158836 RepID=UPI00292EDD1E